VGPGGLNASLLYRDAGRLVGIVILADRDAAKAAAGIVAGATLRRGYELGAGRAANQIGRLLSGAEAEKLLPGRASIRSRNAPVERLAGLGSNAQPRATIFVAM
jgi:hypothetical protein